MGKKRDVKVSTEKKLYALSGNQCYHPDCSQRIIIDGGNTNVGKICHIEAHSPGWVRYNPQMTDEERRHQDNLILLCDKHHCIIDNKENEAEYPVELLKQWKDEHESKQKDFLAKKSSQLLTQAIKEIAAIELEEANLAEDKKKPFNIPDKISYNALKRNRFLIEEYKAYFGKINMVYEEMEQQGVFKKEKLLRVIRSFYLKAKGEFTGGDSSLEVLQCYADDIFERVESTIINKVSEPGQDEILLAVPIIMADAFMRCKIFEEPQS